MTSAVPSCVRSAVNVRNFPAFSMASISERCGSVSSFMGGLLTSRFSSLSLGAAVTSLTGSLSVVSDTLSVPCSVSVTEGDTGFSDHEVKKQMVVSNMLMIKLIYFISMVWMHGKLP